MAIRSRQTCATDGQRSDPAICHGGQPWTGGILGQVLLHRISLTHQQGECVPGAQVAGTGENESAYAGSDNLFCFNRPRSDLLVTSDYHQTQSFQQQTATRGPSGNRGWEGWTTSRRASARLRPSARSFSSMKNRAGSSSAIRQPLPPVASRKRSRRGFLRPVARTPWRGSPGCRRCGTAQRCVP